MHTKIMIIGSPGSGKSTFARKLRDKTGLPLFYLDMIKHKPDRTTISSEEFDKKLKEILVKSQWIIDGNYQRTLEVRMKECDLIILFDLPTKVCLESVKSRIGTKREDMPWVETEETFEGEFKQWIQEFSDESLPEIYQLLEKYKDKEAVRKFNYSFTNGVYGLLGENGAGKTTLMRLICGVLQPTGGSIYCDNIEIASMGAEYRRLLGYLPQDFGYYGDFTAERFLRYMAALKALPEDYADSRIDELLDMVELKNVKKKKLKTFSGGMIRRIGIAQGLLNNPEILILDEPTAGLDPKERVRFRNVISSLGKNRMVLLSTHIVSDIDYIADRILIMKNGELIQEGTEKEITDKVEGCVWKCIVSEKEAGQITSSFIVSNMRSRGENVELRIVSERQPVAGAENVESTLEDAYLYHTQITGGEKNATL